MKHRTGAQYLYVRFCPPKWICKRDTAKTTQRTPHVHWGGTTQCGWMKWCGGRGEAMGRWGGGSAKGEESRYPGCIHPSFNRQTLTTSQESMNILCHLTCMKWSQHAQKRRTVFLVFCWLHKCFATVLVEIVLYFPCALAPFHIFGEFHLLCTWEKILAAGEVWCDGIASVVHCTVK